jgi:hypothetical protein
MDIQIYLVKFKQELIIEITSEIKKNNFSPFEKFELYDKDKDCNLLYDAIHYKNIQNIDKINIINEKIKHLTFDSVIFFNSKIEGEFFYNLFQVNKIFINENSKGIIDLKMFNNLEYINILKWNSKVIFKNDNLINKNIIIWNFNPKDKSLKSLLNNMINIENIEFFHTNIESLDGIENLVNLKKIHIHYGRNLKKIKPLNLLIHLKEVLFINCKKIEDIGEIEKRENLHIGNF